MSSTVKGSAPDSLERRRALLAQRLRQAEVSQLESPLSFGQQRLWFLQQLEPNSALYNVPFLARLSGSLDAAALGRSLNAMIRRHDVLRTFIRLVDEEPVQRVEDAASIELRVFDLCTVAEAERSTEAHRLVHDEVNRPFDLASDLPIRAVLLRLQPEEHWLVLTIHHIGFDEWSAAIFFRELGTYYESIVNDRPPTLPVLPIQYADFAAWQREQLRGPALEKQLAYWKECLGGSPPELALPTDRPRRSTPTFRGTQMARDLGPELKRALHQCAEHADGTPFMVLVAALAALLQRYTRQEDVLIGCPIAGRNRIETQQLIGFFVNTLPLRIDLKQDPSFSELLSRVRKAMLGAYAHQEAPFEKIVEELQPERSLTHLPFTRVMLVLQNEPLEEMQLGPVKVQFLPVATDTSKFDLTLAVQDARQGLVARAEYNTDLFDAATIGRLLGHFELLLRGALEEPARRVSQLPLLPESERHQLVYEWNRTERDYPRDRCIHEIFETRAGVAPGATALVFDHLALSYEELNLRANQLAHYLRRCGVAPESPVAVCLERSSNMIVAWLAILKAGGAYVPLDASYPRERLGFMLRDTQAPVLLTQQSLSGHVPRELASVVCLDSDWELIARESRRNPAPVNRPEHLAYIIYTSGSTGEPKGVAVPHRAVSRLVLNTDYIDFTPNDRVAQVSNASFDAATFEVWGALLNGGQLIGIGQDVALAPHLFARQLREQKITAMFLTSALFNQLAREAPGAFETVRTVIAGGEALDPKWVRSVLNDRPPCRLVNGYGPTENTTFTCCYEIRDLAADALQVPIGRPIANTQVYILDQHLNPVPIGVPGELYAGGDGVARGYWNRAELTSSKFVSNPFDKVGGSQLYRTGDLARYLPDGNIEFLGRIDQQVKIRGFRIELGEIETVLGRHPAVRQCVVVVHGTSADNKRLIAYLLPAANLTPNSSDLRAFLAERLPDYMIPAAFVTLSTLPLTPNGKVDRQALPAPDHARPELERQYAPPRDEVERRLTAIWETVLRIKPIGIQDKFFDLGGHSLLAVRLAAQIQKAFGKELRLATIFQAPTIEQMARILRDEVKESTITAASSIVELQPQGSPPGLYLVHGAGGGMFWGYANLARHLGQEQPLYGFNSRGLDGREELDRIEDLAAQYLRDLRARQPVGPYYLGGYCFGGNVAYEMARQLSEQGQEVALLALFNCAPPNSNYTRIPWTPLWFLRFLRNLIYWGRYFCQWSPSQRREFFRWKYALLRKRFGRLAHSSDPKPAPVEAGDLVDLSSYTPEQRLVWEAHLRALVHYRPKPYPGTAHLFRSPGHPLWCSFDPDYGWGALARGGVSITLLPGAHEKILEEPCVAVLAGALEKVILAAQTERKVLHVPARRQAGEEECLAYWKRRLEGAPPLIDLPADLARCQEQNYGRAHHELRMPEEVANSIEKFASHSSDGFAPILLSSFAAVIHRYLGRADLVLGAVLPADGLEASRDDILPLRCDVSGEPDFQNLVARISKVICEGQQAGAPNLEKLAAALQLEPQTSYTPIVQVVFEFRQERRGGRQRIEQDEVSEIDGTKFDIRFNILRAPDGFSVRIQYNGCLFEAARIERMADHFVTLLSAALEQPKRPISQLPMVPAKEVRQLEQWNQTALEYPRHKTAIELILEQVTRTPEAEALVYGQIRHTYRSLHRRALQIADQLKTNGVVPGQLVGICVERSPDMVASLLGAWLAGAAYVPLDPAYPRERIAFMVQDAQLSAIISQRHLRDSFPENGAKVLILEDLQEACGVDPNAFVAPAISANHVAYVIYTSGSTGKPKGVALEHRSVVALVHWARQVFNDEELSGVLAATSICFDLSVFEIFTPLCWGGRIMLADNALALAALPAKAEVKLINTVPSAIRELLRLKSIPESVQVINLAGEPLPCELVTQLYEKTKAKKVYDLYGPTETTVYSTFALRQAGAAATIGRPLANEEVLLLDARRQLVPIGIPGELYIGGDGLARGYLNRPELTAERFVPHPFKPGCRLYKTGDLAQWRADGNLEFLGRIDHQVKIRGYRIELGEVEAEIKKHPAVRELVLLAREDVPGDKRLVAYVTSNSGSRPTATELRTFVRKVLPDYMVPSAFVFLDQLPLTPNGKVDRKALPAPDREREGTINPAELPRSEIEQKMAALWQEVLGIDRISRQDNFTNLGGHSLLATRLVSRIREVFQIELPLETVFTAPTFANLCEAVVARSGESRATGLPALRKVARGAGAPLAFVQERLWFLDQLNPGGHAYHVPFALRLRGPLNVAALQKAIDEIVSRHESLRATFRYQSSDLVQFVAASRKIELKVREFGDKRGETEKEANRWITAEAQRPFDLSRGPLVRLRLAKLAPDDHVFLLVMHHIISDGWSVALFFEELETLYRTFAAGAPAPQLPSLTIDYVDFAHWQRETMSGERLNGELSYWKNKLAGAPAHINLPTDRPEPAVSTGYAARCTAPLKGSLAHALFDDPARREGSTPFMVSLSALAVTLSHWTHQKDLVIGTVMAGRTRSELERVIGCFMNFVPLRVNLDGVGNGRELLTRVRSNVLEGQTHQDCPFEKIVEAVNPERRLNQNPLYNVALLLQNFPQEIFRHEGLTASPVPVGLDAALLDLRFEIERVDHRELCQADDRNPGNDDHEANGAGANGAGNGSSGSSLSRETNNNGSGQTRYAVTCEYRTDLFEPHTIRELLDSYLGTLEKLLLQPQISLGELQITAGLAQQSQAARERKPAQKFAIAATFTAEPITEPMRYWFGELDLTATVEFAPYNQVFQQLLDPASLLGTNSSGLNAVLIRLQDWQPDAIRSGAGLPTLAEALRRNTAEFVLALKAAAARSTTPYVICLCPPSAGLASDPERANLLAAAENSLAAELERLSGVVVLTSAQMAQRYPVADYYDASADDLGHVPYTPKFFTALATAIMRKYHALQRSPYKVIVLDCDHTLWAGVCGEDGPNGVRLDPPYVALQQFMRAQHEAGRLLCLCSKNNESDPLDVFARRLEMPLRREHFTAWRLNWLSKSDNLKSLASELGLGLDSFIFVDDNPVECAEVAANCPEVLTLQLPADPESIPQFLQHCWVFDHLKLTVEDRRRTELYRQNIHRERLRESSPTLAQFLAGLELKIQIRPMSDADVARVAQLTQRTNQFNCTTRRLTEAEVQLARLQSEIRVVQVRDRFGDYGLVGVIIAQPERGALRVDGFLLSCRVLGRGVEHQMLAHAGQLAVERGHKWLDVHFVKTDRNKPALDFLDNVGARFRQALNGGYVYRFPAAVGAEIAFRPSDQKLVPPAPKTPGGNGAQSAVTFSRKSIPYAAIALATADLAGLVASVEATTVIHRAGTRAGYIPASTILQRQLCELWQKLLKVDQVGVRDNFFELGGHSLLAVRLFAEIEKLVGRRFPLVTLFQAPTVAELAAMLSQTGDALVHPLLVPIQPRGTKLPLFLIHGAGGDVLWGYANLAAHLPADQPIYGIKSRGQAGLEESSSVCDMATDYIQAIRALQPQGPYYLGGYCFGGNVAYEMARQLRRDGEEVALVALIDTAPANAGYERVTWWRPEFPWRFSRNLMLWLRDFADLPSKDRRRFIGRKLRALGRKLKGRLRVSRDSTPVDLEEIIDTTHFPAAELKLWQIHLNALVKHVDQPYDGQVLLLRTRGQPLFCSLAEDFCWGKLARGGVRLQPIPGSHENIFIEPNVQELARTLSEAISTTQMELTAR